MTVTQGRYRISIDPALGLLVIEFSGFFYSVDALAGYLSEKQAAVARLRRPPNQHLTLCDLSDCPPQSGEVLQFFRCSIEDPAHLSRRLAIVVGSALARLQFQRVVTRPEAACFDRREDAVAWLTA